MKQWKSFCGVGMLLLLNSCVEQIDPERFAFEDLLVVESLITDQFVHQEVFLSRTFAINQDSGYAENGARVWLEDQDGVRIDFFEASDGRYQSVRPYGATVGGSLVLYIETASGRQYASEEVEVLNTLPIDSLYAEFTPEPVFRNTFAGRFNFYIDALNNSVDNQYLRWRWNRTYEFSTSTPSRWIFQNGEFIIRERGSENDSLQVEVCWNTLENNELHIQELLVPSEGLNQFPIFDFHSEEGLMKKGFSIEVKLTALSPTAYAYWNDIKEVSEELGTLSEKQPGTIVGNVQSLSDPNELVLGYFEASQEHAVRRQYDREDFFDDGFRVIRADLLDCGQEDILMSDKTEQAVDSMLQVHGLEWTLAYFGTEGAFYLRKECSVCTNYGSNKQPDFWE